MEENIDVKDCENKDIFARTWEIFIHYSNKC